MNNNKSSRIHDLRVRGENIVVERVNLPNGKTVAQYRLANERIAEMLEGIGLDLGVGGNHEACAIIGEAARRLRIPPHPTFQEEYMGEV